VDDKSGKHRSLRFRTQKPTLTIYVQWTLNQTFMGPGYRVSSTIISPWSRGGRTYTEKCDHVSYILFLEKWAKETLNKDIFSHEITKWRREHMCDYTTVRSSYHCPDVISTDFYFLNRLSVLTIPTFRSPSFQTPRSLPSIMLLDCLMA
jgi:hypothetical protein